MPHVHLHPKVSYAHVCDVKLGDWVYLPKGRSKGVRLALCLTTDANKHERSFVEFESTIHMDSYGNLNFGVLRLDGDIRISLDTSSITSEKPTIEKGEAAFEFSGQAGELRIVVHAISNAGDSTVWHIDLNSDSFEMDTNWPPSGFWCRQATIEYRASNDSDWVTLTRIGATNDM